jgi:hypothetical protein
MDPSNIERAVQTVADALWPASRAAVEVDAHSLGPGGVRL